MFLNVRKLQLILGPPIWFSGMACFFFSIVVQLFIQNSFMVTCTLVFVDFVIVQSKFCM